MSKTKDVTKTQPRRLGSDQNRLARSHDLLDVFSAETTSATHEDRQVGRTPSPSLKKLILRSGPEDNVTVGVRQLRSSLTLHRMIESPRSDIYDFCLRSAIDLTQSEHGFLAFVDQDHLYIPAWSRPGQSGSTVGNRPLICPIHSADYWAAGIKTGQTVRFSDSPGRDPLKRGFPGDPGNISTCVSVPFVVGDKPLAMITMANKEGSYTSADVRFLERFLTDLWHVIQRSKTLDAIDESEKRYRLLVDTMNEGLVVLDEKFKVRYANDGFCKMLDYRRDDIASRSVAMFLSESDQSTFYEKIAESREQIPRSYESDWLTRDGRRVPAIVSPRPIFDTSNNFVGSFAVITDITEQKENARKLTRMNESLAAEQAALTQKNIAMQEIMQQIESEKDQIRAQVQANIERIVMPIMRRLDEHAAPDLNEYLRLLEDCLLDVAAPFMNQMESRFSSLSPRELEICNMIRNGISSKEIASLLNTSVHTVHNQRKQIRRKLGLTGKGNNLLTFLQSNR